MKKLLYTTIALMAAQSTLHAMHSETSSEPMNHITQQIELYIKFGDNNPQNLLLATKILSQIADNESINPNQKKIWYNWIIRKTAKIPKEDRRVLIESINALKPTIKALPPTLASILELNPSV
jgi:hypothetical protein